MNTQSDNFKRAWAFAMRWESSKLENVPGDRGGLTKYGVDQASHPHVNIRLLTEADAAAIYHDNEWMHCRCDELPADLGVAVFDFAMNSGMGEAIQILQAVVGVKVDGFIGPRTLAAAGQQPPILTKYIAHRATYDRAIAMAHPDERKFLAGWINRVNDLRKYLAA